MSLSVLKLIKEVFLTQNNDAVLSVHKEISILKTLRHNHIVEILGYGDKGQVIKPNGRVLNRLIYIHMDYVSEYLMYDYCVKMGAMGENAGRYYFKQILDALLYMKERGVCHRDLKLENLLFDQVNKRIIVADFGFATRDQVECLTEFRGTRVYMAPEILSSNDQSYNGYQVDVFSAGVILFIIVNGIFPFKEAKNDGHYFKFLIKNFCSDKNDELSPAFKQLIQRMLAPKGKDRPTLEQIKEDAWLNL